MSRRTQPVRDVTRGNTNSVPTIEARRRVRALLGTMRVHVKLAARELGISHRTLDRWVQRNLGAQPTVRDLEDALVRLDDMAYAPDNPNP